MMDEIKRQRVEFILARNSSSETFTGSLGLSCDLLEDDFAKGHFVGEKRLCNPLGIVHGGVYFTLMDQLAGMMAAVSGRVGVTLQSSVNYLKSAKMGETVHCEVKAVHMGRSTALLEGRCCNEAGQTCCTATFQFLFIGEVDVSAK